MHMNYFLCKKAQNTYEHIEHIKTFREMCECNCKCTNIDISNKCK